MKELFNKAMEYAPVPVIGCIIIGAAIDSGPMAAAGGAIALVYALWGLTH